MDNYLPESFSYIPDIKISSKQVFGTKTDIRIPAFSKKNSLVPNTCFEEILISGIYDNDSVKRLSMIY